MALPQLLQFTVLQKSTVLMMIRCFFYCFISIQYFLSFVHYSAFSPEKEATSCSTSYQVQLLVLFSLFYINRISYGQYFLCICIHQIVSIFQNICFGICQYSVHASHSYQSSTFRYSDLYVSISVNMHLVFQIRNKGCFYIYLVLFIIFQYNNAND